MIEYLYKPFPWYVTGPLIGLIIPALLIIGNKPFGISTSFQHICAACIPAKVKFFKYDWKRELWSMFFVMGLIGGGILGGIILHNPNPVAISDKTTADLTALGIHNFSGLQPTDIFNFQSLFTIRGFILMVVGGFLVGFGTRYADGCTSGHTIMGISNLQVSSLVATCCFFIGGLISAWFIIPIIMHL